MLRLLKFLYWRTRNNVYKFLRRHFPYEAYVKIMYVISRSFRRNVKDGRKYIPKALPSEHERRLKIVFICTFPAAFNSLKSIYLEAVKDKNIDAYILACPEKVIRKGYDLSHEEYEAVNYAYDMCVQFAPDNTINAYDYPSQKWFDLEEFAPDYVFVARPYDIHMPPCYKSSEMRKYTRICLCIYGYILSSSTYASIYSVEFIKSLSVIFAESRAAESALNNTMKFLRFPSLRVKFMGYPRFDLYSNNYYEGGGY